VSLIVRAHQHGFGNSFSVVKITFACIIELLSCRSSPTKGGTMKTVLLRAILCVALVSCASSLTTFAWQKEGVTQEQFKRDDAACRFEATKAPSSYPTGYLALDERGKPLYELCMRSKGYTLKETK